MLKIDARESKSHPHAMLQIRTELPEVEIDDSFVMEFGDYAFNGCYSDSLGRGRECGVEVATPSDAWGKVDSNRLAYQLAGMLEQYDVVILHITSPLNATNGDRIWVPGVPGGIGSYTRLMDVLQSAQAHGVIVNYGLSYEDVGPSIAKLYRWWNKPEDSHTYFRSMTVVRETKGPTKEQKAALSAAGIPLGKPLDRRVQTLMTIPGLGEDRAYSAIAHYKSLWTLFHMDLKALQKIPGWGKTTAERFQEFLISPVEMAGEASTEIGIEGIDR